MPDNLYLKLREERIKRGMSQKELGDLVGVPQQVINRLEQGQRKLDVELFEKICKALNITRIGSFGIDLVTDYYRTEPQIDNLKKNTLAAHFDGGEFTEEELKKIKEYAELLKAARPALDKFVEYATTGLDDLLVPDKE